MNYAGCENWFSVIGPYGLPDDWRGQAVLYWRDGWPVPQAHRMDDQSGELDAAGLYYFGGKVRRYLAACDQFDGTLRRI